MADSPASGGGWNPRDVAAMLGNPFYAIEFHPDIFAQHEPLVSEVDWIAANVGLIEEQGPQVYLANLLSVLKGNFPRG